MWSAFWTSNDHESHPFLQSAIELKDMLQTKRRVECVQKFEQVSTETTEIRARFETFIQECQEKSELCRYFGNFQKTVTVIKQLITSDRDGNWPLHVRTVQETMGILHTICLVVFGTDSGIGNHTPYSLHIFLHGTFCCERPSWCRICCCGR